MGTQPRHGQFLGVHRGGWHRVAYTEWGDAANPHVVVCVHGLTRNSRDFDALGRALAPSCRVVCMDVPGRGDSDWLPDAAAYGFPVYEPDIAALIARVTANTDPRRLMLDWVGTSMGGLLGITLAARSGTPIRRLVLNDIGPFLSSAALQRIRATHAKAAAEFDSVEAVERRMRVTCATFGPLTDAQWRELAVHGSRRTERGTYRLACDPAAIAPPSGARCDAQAADEVPPPVDLWKAWDRIRCPTLALRGSLSDVLMAETAREMQARGPRARVVEFPGIGHAPWLVDEAQIAPVREFLLAS